MAAGKIDPRTLRLAAALKENLKRRKAQGKAKAGSGPAQGTKSLDTAPQAGPENKPELGPKSAPKRN
jgi:hypothetical protein